jgi:cyclic pyranopterin monophosphate synthase
VSADRDLTHIDDHGHARMVDVTGKAVTARRAVARCVVRANPDATKALAEDEDAVPFARAAGVQAAKRTWQLIPLCHPLPLDDVDVRVEVGVEAIDVTSWATTVERTGVEMEALTACGVAGLTLLMAVRRVDPTATLDRLTLWHKSGGRSGTWERHDDGTVSQPGG